MPLTRERLEVFATLATMENRPVEDVLSECLADMAAHLVRSRHALHLDEADRVSLERYLDSLEAEADEQAARDATTPAMRATAYAGDIREAFPSYHDDEEEELAHRTGGAGYVELTLAMEG